MKVSHAVLLFLVSNSACQCFRHDIHLAVDALGKSRHGNTVAPAVFKAVAATSSSSRKLPQEGPDLNHSSLLSPTVKEEHGGSNIHSMVENNASITTDHRFNASSAIEKSATTILSYANATGPDKPIIEKQILWKVNRLSEGGILNYLWSKAFKDVVDERQVELWPDKLVYYTPAGSSGTLDWEKAKPTVVPLEGFTSTCTVVAKEVVAKEYGGKEPGFRFQHSKRNRTGGFYIFLAENSICHRWCDEINNLLCKKRAMVDACNTAGAMILGSIEGRTTGKPRWAEADVTEKARNIKSMADRPKSESSKKESQGFQYTASNGKVLISAATTDPCCNQNSISEFENAQRSRSPCARRDGGGCRGGYRRRFQEWVDSCDDLQLDICIDGQQYEYQDVEGEAKTSKPEVQQASPSSEDTQIRVHRFWPDGMSWNERFQKGVREKLEVATQEGSKEKLEEALKKATLHGSGVPVEMLQAGWNKLTELGAGVPGPYILRSPWTAGYASGCYDVGFLMDSRMPDGSVNSLVSLAQCQSLCDFQVSCNAINFVPTGADVSGIGKCGIRSCESPDLQLVTTWGGRDVYTKQAAAILPDPDNDGKKCGDPGNPNRVFHLRNSDATQDQCTKKCYQTPECKALSMVDDQLCIGCRVALDVHDPTHLEHIWAYTKMSMG